MTWCRQASSYYQSHCGHMVSLCHNELKKPLSVFQIGNLFYFFREINVNNEFNKAFRERQHPLAPRSVNE